MFTLISSALLLSGTAYAQACDEAPDPVLCEAVEFATLQANASFGHPVISESGPARLRPSTLYAKFETIQAVSDAVGCTPVSTWSGSYNVPSANGVTSLGETVTASLKQDRVAGTFDSTVFADSYSKITGNGKVMASVGSSDVTAGVYMRVRGKTGVWAGLQVSCPTSGDAVYQSWLGGLPNYDVLTCGNGVLDAAEECDDNNLLDDDGCSATCNNESCDPHPDPVCQCFHESDTPCDASEPATSTESMCLVGECINVCVQAIIDECLGGNPIFSVAICTAIHQGTISMCPEQPSVEQCIDTRKAECGCPDC